MWKFRSKVGRLLIIAGLLTCIPVATMLVQTVNAQSRQDRQLMARAEAISGDRFSVKTSSPLGVRVYASERPGVDMLRAIDAGFTKLFTVARRQGYRARLEYSSYTVFIGRADRIKDSNGGYSPDIAVPAGQYAGGGYDQGGYVYAAGMVLAFNPSAFLIAVHNKNLDRVSDVVRFEGEHIILYFNDRGLYERTADHSRGGGHPILQ